jgi:release factor glutamine methyltransferase
LHAGDWGQGLTDRFDLIVSNPPYVARPDAAHLEPELLAFEPELALFGGDDGLEAYRALLPDCARLLAEGGVVCLEIGQGQGQAVAAVAQRHGLRLVRSRPDLAGIERCLVLRPDAPGRRAR